MSTENCCVVTCNQPLNELYWDNQYLAKATGWDLGEVSPPLRSYIDQIQNKDIAILIPGCGNSYEASYLLEQGFTNITVIDIAASLVDVLKTKFENNPHITIVLGDFFDHNGTYDLILEQTFFCALPPKMRQKYVWKMQHLLTNNGTLAGLLFNRTFDVSPPFGGDLNEYKNLFHGAFKFNVLEMAKNSISNRQNAELFFEFKKNSALHVELYTFEGITCSGCKNTVTDKFSQLDEIENVSMNADFSEILLVSNAKIGLDTLQNIVSYDENYSIKNFIK